MSLALRTDLDQLAGLVDERDRLIHTLRLDPSPNDNYDLETLLKRCHRAIQASDSDALMDKYNAILDSLAHDPVISPDEYRYVPPRKSVRFETAPSEADMRNELMGTKTFAPYTDNEASSAELMQQNQAQLLQQDLDLDVLHDSVKVQKSMGLSINDEIDSHLIMLSDLEAGVDGAGVKLGRTNTRLTDFRSRVQENGSLVTIVTLTVILILLLVVLN